MLYSRYGSRGVGNPGRGHLDVVGRLLVVRDAFGRGGGRRDSNLIFVVPGSDLGISKAPHTTTNDLLFLSDSDNSLVIIALRSVVGEEATGIA